MRVAPVLCLFSLISCGGGGGGGGGGAQQTLSVTSAGPGGVTSAPAGIACRSSGGTCSGKFNQGAVVTLTAHPDPAASFGGWTGGCSSQSSTCAVTLSADQQVNAVFNDATTAGSHVLTVNVSGSGTVVSSPAGINCPGQCSASFAGSTQVTLTETTSGGATFSGWGGACSGTGACSVTLSADQSVSAGFSVPANTYTVTVVINPTGAGSVTSAPAGINCPDQACSAPFPAGTQVTFSAQANTNENFSGWTGACSGSASCTVSAQSGTVTVGANFTSAGY
jgi:hypothetical protein